MESLFSSQVGEGIKILEYMRWFGQKVGEAIAQESISKQMLIDESHTLISEQQ